MAESTKDSNSKVVTTRTDDEPWLLPWEKNFSPPRESPSSVMSDEDLNVRYVQGETRIVTEQARYSIVAIRQMLEAIVPGTDERQYKLDPEYQRRHRWSDLQKSRLIESFLMNIPVPPVFIYERDFNRYEVMDGRQRLTAISDFYNGDFALTGLEYWKELNGRTYANLPSKIRDGIDRRYISAIVLLKESVGSGADGAAREARLKKLVFARLNTGGVSLEGQELRNAIYGGPLNALCLELSEYQPFREMWGLPPVSALDKSDGAEDSDEGGEDAENSDEVGDDAEMTTQTSRTYKKKAIDRVRKMEDVELVLEFFAYRHSGRFPNALNKKTQYLDWFITSFEFTEAQLAEYRELFKKTVDLVWGVWGAAAFHPSWNKRPMKILYDPLMFVASRYAGKPDGDLLILGKDVLKSAMESVLLDNKKAFSGRTTNSSFIETRNNAVAGAFASALVELKSRS